MKSVYYDVCCCFLLLLFIFFCFIVFLFCSRALVIVYTRNLLICSSRYNFGGEYERRSPFESKRAAESKITLRVENSSLC